MMHQLTNVFLALCGVLALIGVFSDQEKRRSHLIWATMCFVMAAIGLSSLGDKLPVVKGILSLTAIAFFVIANGRQLTKGKDQNAAEPHSGGDGSTRATK